MAFTKLGGVLDFEEYRKLLSIMAQEKELRVHDVTELEDLLEDMESAGGGQRQEREFIKLPDDSDTDEEMVDE